MNTKTQIKKELAKYGRMLAKKGLVAAGGGNISARYKDSIFIKASGARLEDAKENDFIELDLRTGVPSRRSGIPPKRKLQAGKACAKKPSIEYKMHVACFLKRPDVGAVIHAHPPVATGFATSGRKLCDITAEFAMVLKTGVPTIKFVTPGTEKLAAAVANKIKNHNALLLANHGTIAVGKDLKEAFERTVVLEEAAKICLSAEVFGKVKSIKKSAIKSLLG